MTWEVLIYPAFRALVSKLSSLAASLALVCAVTATGELVLAPLGGAEVALFSGSLSELCMSLLLAVVLWIAMWCHIVLLAGRGMEGTRYVLLVAAMLGLLMPVCAVYMVLTGEPLLLRQAELPLICTVLLAFCLYLNLPRGVAAGRSKLLSVSLFAAAVFLYALTNEPILVWASNLFKIVACAAIYFPLRALQRYALRVVSLPPLKV